MKNKNVHFSFEDLKVYQKALDFVDVVYDLTHTFPKHEQNRYILSELSKMISGLTKYLKSNN